MPLFPFHLHPSRAGDRRVWDTVSVVGDGWTPQVGRFLA